MRSNPLSTLRFSFEPRLKRAACAGLDRLGLLKPLTFVQWLVTYCCNFRCPFCEANAGEADRPELTTAEAEAFVDDLGRMGVRRLVVSGGEPLVRGDLPELLTRAALRGLSLGLVTNGWFVPDLWSELEHLPWFLLFTSLDGPPAHHDRLRGTGSFARVLQSLELFAGRHVPTRIINTVVMAETLPLLPALFEEVRRSAATRWHLTPVAPVGRAAGSEDSLLDGEGLRRLGAFLESADGDLPVGLGEAHGYLWPFLGKKRGRPFFCGAGRTRCSVMPDGTVLGCHQPYDLGLGVGNVKDRPFSELWHEALRPLRRRALPEGCRDCPQKGACAGGCWAEMATRGHCLRATLDPTPWRPGAPCREGNRSLPPGPSRLDAPRAEQDAGLE
ncbi:MAG: radical SAM protein [Deltaproteobacteria bacterium]|nr:radical SAM protein [Deltaproteobacteria bacterium]